MHQIYREYLTISVHVESEFLSENHHKKISPSLYERNSLSPNKCNPLGYIFQEKNNVLFKSFTWIKFVVNFCLFQSIQNQA